MSATSLASRNLFGTPLAATITRSARLSRCGACRFTLTRMWAGDGGRVCFIGLNPSAADHRRDDPTVGRWIHFARSWGCAGRTAVNLYPLRSASPAARRTWAQRQAGGPDRSARDRIQRDNLPILVREAKAAALVVACWGAGAWDPAFVDRVLGAIGAGEAPWPDVHCFGLTAGGAPIHPMARGRSRIPDHAKPMLWKVGTPSGTCGGWAQAPARRWKRSAPHRSASEGFRPRSGGSMIGQRARRGRSASEPRPKG